MRNSLEILEDIRKALLTQGFPNEKKELDDEILGSSTGRELCSRSASKLLTMQKNNPRIKAALGHLIGEFISYCHTIGLYPNAAD